FAYDLSALNVQDSPWLIVGKLDGTARIAPVIKWGLPVLQTNDLLLNALCEADSEQRKKYFNELIFEIDNNPL
ncbi:TPA: hypothetical protein ACNTCU_004989, partial [Escherichia coli]